MIKLSSLSNDYLTENQALSWSYRETTQRAFAYFVLCVGNLAIDRIRFGHVNRFMQWLYSSGRSKTSANMYVRAIRPVFGWAVANDLLKDNPFEGLKLFKVAGKKIHVYEPEEFAALLRACPSDLWCARLLAAKTAGLRRSEVLNLTVHDVDFKSGMIYIQPKGDTKATWRWEPKDRESRKVPLVAQLESLLLDLAATNRPYLMIPDRRYKYLLTLKKNKMLHERQQKTPVENFNRDFRKIRKRAGVFGTFHDLRRTYITEMLELGLAPHQVRELSGHSSLEVMETYYCTIRETLYKQARSYAETAITGAPT